MKRIIFITLATLISEILFAQNKLAIPSVLSGTTFNLNVQNGMMGFYPGFNTSTYGINGPLLGPTLVINKWDLVKLNVSNNLTGNGNSTTMHWHGLHLPAKDDGGPHQVILQGTTWSPAFRMLNNAGTFWYHPHGLGKTDLHVAKGLAGLIIVKDSAEAALSLPRTYGIDDFPIIVQSKAFDELQQIAIATDMDTALFVNGTLNPYLDVPQQVVRFRLLNGSSLRTYNFGLSNNQSFYQIASDGGILDSSVEMTRLRLSPGERAEILIDFAGKMGDSIYLKSYASELPIGIYGADSVGNSNNEIHDYSNNKLNGTDFDLLELHVVSTTSGAITSVPGHLIPVKAYNPSMANRSRTILMDTIRLISFETPNRAEGPFGMNNRTFDMDYINDTVDLNSIEIWNLVNKTLVAHPFHIHDVQFNVLEKSGMPPPANERGWKDVVLVMPEDSVKFITKFETFSDNTIPYMYHCHLLHHEDDGMMGSFIIRDTSASSVSRLKSNLNLEVFPNPSNGFWVIKGLNPNELVELELVNSNGQVMREYSIYSGQDKLEISNETLTSGIYFLKIKNRANLINLKLIKFN